MAEGLVVIGDALATVSPLHGEGMSIAALGAKTLADTVRKQWGHLGGRARTRTVSRSCPPPVSTAPSGPVIKTHGTDVGPMR